MKEASKHQVWSKRQGEVLGVALEVLVSEGDRLTMNAVAQQARCSKESLYKWFGDRDGLLEATVQWQAAKVRVPVLDDQGFDRAALKTSLEQFGRDLLGVLSSHTSVALNRVAMAHAGADKRNLGALVLENGRRAMGRRLKPVLEAGARKQFLRFEDSEIAFRTFFGLVVRDVQIRLLLGEECHFESEEIAADAKRACAQFFTLYGA